MNQEKFNEDPFAMGSQTIEWLKSELASLRAYVEKMAERPRERVINFYSRSENVDESLRLSLSRIRSKLEAEELSETNEEPLGLDFSAKNLWNTILDEYGNDEACRDYQEWKEENDKYSFEDLKAKQKQAMFGLLNSRFLRYCHCPTGAEVKNRRLIISEDDLEVGTRIPWMLPSECAKLEKFFVWRGDHLINLNYEKLEHYIRKHHHLLKRNDLKNIAAFDMRLDMIQEDMIDLRPEEAKNHKDYETNNTMEILKECNAILSTCQHLLKEGVRDSIIKEYLEKMLFDEKMKEEARRKLGKKTRAKFLCEIMAAISNCYILKPEATFGELANCMRQKIKTVEAMSIKTYIMKAAGNRQSDLQIYTSNSIAELKDNPYNPFCRILTD